MKRTTGNMALLLVTILIMALSIWGPEGFARYRDQAVLEEIHIKALEGEGEGYLYALSRSEKLYILAEAMNSQALLGSEQYAATRKENTGAYAFIENRREPAEAEQKITADAVFEACSSSLAALKAAGILPDSIKAVEADSYDAVRYSAIDVLEPRNNVAVWKISLSGSLVNVDKENRLIDACFDADDGKVYEFYVRTELSWEELDPDAIIEAWSSYLGLDAPAPYEVENPLLETTPYFKKYVFAGAGEGKTVVTVGFYDGINELFIKISK